MNYISKNAELQQSCITAVKSRFFAQYWGQNVMKLQQKSNIFDVEVGTITINNRQFDKQYLQLKPLSKLSDKDYSKIMELYVKPIFKSKQNYIEEVSDFKIFMIEEIDFLRSKGYAIPFMGYSVDDLISFGCVQLL